MLHTANHSPSQRPSPADVIYPCRPFYIGIESPRLAASSVRRRHHHPHHHHSRRVSNVPCKRSMNAEVAADSYDSSMSVPKFAHSITPEEYVGDAFFAPAQAANRIETGRFRSLDRPRSSASTSASVSTESSPTTTQSVLGSASTPGTSPDTPASSQSYTYPSLSMAMRASQENKTDFRPPQAPLNKKPRNLKNLAVNTSSAFPLARAVSTASLPMDVPKSPLSSSSLPFSPAFAPSLAPPRRRPSGPGLTIKTPALGGFSLPEQVPQAHLKPSLQRPEALRHFQSSPSLPLHSSAFPPEGGMRLPDFATNLADSPLEHDASQPLATYDPPQSQEQKPAAYPHGPITIYDPHVDLYFEPTMDEASKYDVIFNVASEVQNPFRLGGDLNVVPIDLQAAVDALAEHSSSPSTPRANMPPADPSDDAGPGAPEYIHVPWEHNTDIVPGTESIPPLYDIIRIIDSRVRSGKRVLIHCQCGVSRSASLIVAYGLYKNPGITVQEAYDAVKQKSEWIGPNMNLIMQLQEFRNILLKSGRPFSLQLAAQRPPSSRPLHGRATPNDVDGEAGGLIPQTAPLPQPTSKNIPLPVNTQNIRDVSPGPSSAPSDFHWPSNHRIEMVSPTSTVVPIYPETSVVDATGQVLQSTLEPPQQAIKGNKKRLAIRTGQDLKPVKAAPQALVLPNTSFFQQQHQQPVESPRAAEFAMAPVRADDIDETFGITSPRPIEFTPSPTLSFSSSPSSPNQPPLGSLTSPRSSEFAMTSIHQPDLDPSFGLTSPRASAFGTQLPYQPLQSPPSRFGMLYPAEDVGASNAQARAELRSRLGLNSSRSNNDMRAEYSQTGPVATRTVGATTIVPPPESNTIDVMDLSDALMSPRATEFTSNPFHDMLGDGLDGEGVGPRHGGSGDATPVALDPRSPPLKGGNPIVRNILDVL